MLRYSALFLEKKATEEHSPSALRL